MTDRRPPNTPGDIETALVDLATVVAFPPTPDLATVVGARLRTWPAGGRSRRPIRRSLPRSLLLAATIALLIVGATLALRLGLDLLSLEFGPLPSMEPTASATTASADPGRVGAGLRLGTSVTLDEVREQAPFPILVPAALGPPDAVYLGGPQLRGQVSLVYRAEDGLPASRLLDGAGVLVTQNHGEPDEGLARKLADAGLATVEAVEVDGAAGFWIAGGPHVFWYLAPDGSVIEVGRRLVGDTLVWERDGVLYRIEGAIPLARALEIARSMG